MRFNLSRFGGVDVREDMDIASVSPEDIERLERMMEKDIMPELSGGDSDGGEIELGDFSSAPTIEMSEEFAAQLEEPPEIPVKKKEEERIESSDVPEEPESVEEKKLDLFENPEFIRNLASEGGLPNKVLAGVLSVVFFFVKAVVVLFTTKELVREIKGTIRDFIVSNINFPVIMSKFFIAIEDKFRVRWLALAILLNVLLSASLFSVRASEESLVIPSMMSLALMVTLFLVYFLFMFKRQKGVNHLINEVDLFAIKDKSDEINTSLAGRVEDLESIGKFKGHEDVKKTEIVLEDIKFEDEKEEKVVEDAGDTKGVEASINKFRGNMLEKIKKASSGERMTLSIQEGSSSISEMKSLRFAQDKRKELEEMDKRSRLQDNAKDLREQIRKSSAFQKRLTDTTNEFRREGATLDDLVNSPMMTDVLAGNDLINHVRESR